jgi:ParB family transcriptional regulator, chromosome partitioning protein
VADHGEPGAEGLAAAEGSGSRGMGRGLAAILPSGRGAEGLRHLAVELIGSSPVQPRRDFDADALLALAESVKARGILQPLVVRPLASGGYELVAGERRLRAAKLAGLERVPAVVRDTEESERLELALIENMAREDLNPVEEARACATLVEDLGLTKEELGRRVGRSRAGLSNLIRLLDLPDDALSLIESGELSEGHGRAILLCKEHEQRRRLAREAARRGWSVRETERHAKAAEEGFQPRASAASPPADVQDVIATAEEALSAALGREVRVSERRGRYRVELELENPREALELAERILRQPAS